MTSETNKAAARRIFEEVFNTGQLELLGELAADDLVVHYADGTEAVRGLSAYRELFETGRQAFGEQYFVIEDMLSEGDRVATRWTMRAVHRGAYMGAPASGREVTQSGTSIYRLAGGKVAEAWVHTDDLGLLRQIGALSQEG
jgi:steroid delta-isomerase-like uncharacterized protein